MFEILKLEPELQNFKTIKLWQGLVSRRDRSALRIFIDYQSLRSQCEIKLTHY